MKHQNKNRKTSLLSLIMSLCSLSAIAQPTVIADLGGESAVRFYEPIQPVHSPEAPKHHNAVPSQLSEAQLLPVVSHKFSVGKVNAQAMNLPGIQPFFLVGYDDVSMDWLNANRDKLIKLQATGLVINVKTEAELQALRDILPELTFMPAPADSLSERLGIQHYPLLLTSEGIYQ
ncbi:integrating conjugative element protein [Actinobacillus porcinus]|uniref:integrating conjugative element protein n=1 Tax=Actinobacillus porcinus TaxID=51048 RepID=UPI002A908C07|nr:integrating conjugative element protein [Actinobacillus porcinus]MDY6216095.1 integrating conjugative element protein [Actinobacillus porcinus]